MSELIKPVDVKIKDRDGVEKTFVISRFPAIAGREIIAKYPVSNIPKLGEYEASKEAMLLMLSHVGVYRSEGEIMRLKSEALINNHVIDGEQLLRIEFEMLKYNTNFFGNAGSSGFLESLIKKYLPLIMSTLTASLPASVQRDLQAGLNLKAQSTSKKP